MNSIECKYKNTYKNLTQVNIGALRHIKFLKIEIIMHIITMPHIRIINIIMHPFDPTVYFY